MTPEQVKAQIEVAMRNNLISSQEEAEAAIEFVANLLEIDIDRTIENEPYAVDAIREMKVSHSRVDDLQDMLSSIL